MERLFRSDGELTKLMPGDRIVFTQKGNDPDIIDFYRGEEKLFFSPLPQRLIIRDEELPRMLLHVERIRIARLIAAATGTNLRTLELGERRTIFQFI